MGAGRGVAGKKFAWKKFAIAAGVLVGLVWVFGPRKDVTLGGVDPDFMNPDLSEVDYETSIHMPAPTLPSDLEDRPPAHTTTTSSLPRPTSPATDPDLLGTVHCTKPYTSGSPLVQYGLMIDAGSTGSRIHIYKFHNCGPSPTYEYEVFKQTHPGLSAFREDPLEAAKSLDILLDEALDVVPTSLRKCTPVAVKATAGLRLLGPEQSGAILEAVRNRIEEKYPFVLQGEDSVAIMDGKDEGVYAWITANYLLDSIRASSPKNAPTYAVLDLGGASTQIVFEPTFDPSKSESKFVEGDHKYELKFGGKTHVLYQHSYLGYGLMHARKSVHRLVEFISSVRHATGHGENGVVPNPCLARHTERVVEIEDERLGETRKVTMSGMDVGGLESCNRVMELVMAKDAICELKPCSFDGVYQPSILDTFPDGKILLLSYFYDRIKPLLPKDTAPPRLTVSTLATLADQVCLGPPSWAEHWANDPEAMAELEDRPEYCLDLTFMHALLRLGYEFAEEREVTIGKQLDGTELGWALGAGIALVGGELKCDI
ncbi:hypothetical protein JAAARDRAFT_122462 [Jaapia argillacea MUCL 33604]|uniref:guanosine-diphosphatase n=1 Tax=Jaapia argillacea MUCL 33604 TaxID=933084 RepID=A0A067Q6X5_9AGAM|nr:hypothetical protein JAAARDRAFT_122462 [Jaapia argillacea MUCL 33604]